MPNIASLLTILQQAPALVAALSSNPDALAEVSAFASDPGHIPGPVVIPNCAQVRLFWTLGNGKVATNVLHGSYTPPFTPTTTMANQLMTALVSALTSSALAGQLHTSTSLAFVGIRDISAAHTTEFVSNINGAAGTGGGTALPPQTSLVTTLRTGQAGQAGRGRVYLPGFASTADVGNGIATAAAVAAAASFIGLVQGDMGTTGIGLALGIAHPARNAYTGKTGTAHPARAPGIVPVTAVVVENNVWDTQRRRAEP